PMTAIIDVVEPSQLTEADRAAWRALQSGEPAYGSPFLSPDWLDLLVRVDGPDRERSRVAILRDEGRPRAFLPVRVCRGRALAAGSPFCDYAGPVAEPGAAFPADALLKALRVAEFDFSNASDPDGVLADHVRDQSISWVIDLSNGYEAYAAERRQAGTDVLRDCAKKLRKLEREQGSARFTELSTSETAFDQLFGWKREQLRATRQTDIFSRDWSMQLMQAAFENQAPEFGGAMFTLEVGGLLIAAHFALRGAGVVHAWMIAHHPAFARYSPGLLLLCHILQWAAGSGIREVDLGPGDYRFKSSFANRARMLSHGYLARPSPGALVRGAQYALQAAAEALPLGALSQLPGKARRRLDIVRALKGV
ncbi:MAG: GNAT family N-acetyltransferase, partial [Phenylobacterium sp.]